MISVSNLGKVFGAQILFEGVAFQLNPGDSYGLVGANGSGKSTLLKMLSSEEPASEGTISIPKRLRLGILRQDHFAFEQERIIDVAMMGNADLWRSMAEKERILETAEESFDAERYSELEDVILRHDGYSAEARAGEILEGLGIETELHTQPLSTLSGGFKLRVLLAQTLAAQPQALFLDEPTNHLDILSIRWLEKFLQSFSGIVVVISHDHRFLDNVSTHILDVDYQTITLYKGDYTSFVEQKVAQRERKEKDIGKRQKEIAHHQAFVDRFRAKATKARQAKSKQKVLDRIVIEPLPMSSRRYPRFRFDQERPSGREALKIEGVSKAFGDNKVLEDVSLTVERGDRLAVIGPNGIGKSTLLKIAMGELEPDQGSVEWGYEARPGYFAQDHHELLQPGRATVESWLWDICPGETIGFVRGQLAAVLFSKEEVEKRLGALSGGEATRLVFARLAVEKANVLVLDEPTNHLDLEAIEALVHGLRAYPGTLIIVSHDRWFVAQLADRIVEISPSGIRDYRGTYDEYVIACGDDHLDADAILRQKKRKGARRKAKSARSDRAADASRKRELTKERDRLAGEIEKGEERVNEINELFCDPTFFEKTPPKQVNKLEREQADLKTKVEEMITAWETVETELEDRGHLS